MSAKSWICAVCNTENYSFVCSKCSGKQDCCDKAKWLNQDRKNLIRAMRRHIIPAEVIVGRTWEGKLAPFTKENEAELRAWLTDEGFEVICERNVFGTLKCINIYSYESSSI